LCGASKRLFNKKFYEDTCRSPLRKLKKKRSQRRLKKKRSQRRLKKKRSQRRLKKKNGLIEEEDLLMNLRTVGEFKNDNQCMKVKIIYFKCHYNLCNILSLFSRKVNQVIYLGKISRLKYITLNLYKGVLFVQKLSNTTL
jgi:transposase